MSVDEGRRADAAGPVMLEGRALALARIAWPVVAGLALAVFIAKLSLLARLLTHPSPTAQGLLAQVGVSPGFRAAWELSFEAGAALIFFAVAFLLARQRFRLLPAWLASVAFLCFGASGSTSGVLAQQDPRWVIPVVLLGFIFRITFVAFLLVFPDGRFTPSWTRWVAAAWAVVVLFILLPPQSPISTGWPPAIGVALQLLLPASIIAAQTVRYRAVSDPAQREQTRWVVFGVITAITISAALELPRYFIPALSEPTPAGLVYELVFTAVWNLSLALIPITVAIAIIRQRLFDIDILIRRSLVYVLLTAILAGVLAVSTSGAQKLFLAFTGEQSAWAPLLATLVVVAAFDPVKKALQDAVDRRFKAPGDAASRLAPFRNAIETRISAVDTRALLMRLLRESAAALEASGGAAYVDRGGEPELVGATGAWSGASALEAPVEFGGRRLGRIALAARRGNQPYSAADRAALEQAARVAAQAILQDGAAR